MKKSPRRKMNPQFTAVQHKHDLGQHFLYDLELLNRLVSKVHLSGADRVLEIGAGAGTLTRVLCETASRVIAVEVDAALMPNLKMLEAEYANLTVINRDIRKVDLGTLWNGYEFSVAANIPYSITSQIFDLFLGKGFPIRQISVMVQKEVADKLTATPGDNAFGLMSVRCRYYCVPEIIALVPASAFTPPPKVDSAFVNLTFRKAPLLPVADENLLWRLVKAGYKQRRKTLQNALKAVVSLSADVLPEVLAGMGLPIAVRGEALGVEQWIALSNALSAKIRSFPASAGC